MHMPRYQLVNSFEALLLPSIPGGKAVQTGCSVVLRNFNNYAGSLTWIWWARKVGLQ